MKIYTKSGDEGVTGLFAGGRVSKDHARIEAYGTVDELNSLLGLARTAEIAPHLAGILERVQNELFLLGTQLATGDKRQLTIGLLDQQHVQRCERDIDRLEQDLPPLKEFILPGGTPAAATLHVARTVCRRAERRLVSLRSAGSENVPDVLLWYLNRLSDLLFVMARAANAAAGEADQIWQRE